MDAFFYETVQINQKMAIKYGLSVKEYALLKWLEERDSHIPDLFDSYFERDNVIFFEVKYSDILKGLPSFFKTRETTIQYMRKLQDKGFIEKEIRPIKYVGNRLFVSLSGKRYCDFLKDAIYGDNDCACGLGGMSDSLF